MLSSALPLTGAPPTEQLDAAPLAYENPGIDDGTTLFDGFSRTLIITGEPKKSLLADLDGDGLGDLAVIFNGSSELNIFYCDLVNGFSALDRTVVTLPYEITDLAIGDMDVDGKQDIVLVLNVTSLTNLVVLYQSSNFQLASSYQKTIDYLPLAVEVGNFTGTNRLEIALVTNGVVPNNPQFAIYQWTGSTYTPLTAWISLYNSPLNMVEPRLITSGDLNLDQDGLRDLVIGDRTSGTVAGFLNPGNPSWGTNIRISRHGPTALMLGDMDGDAPSELTVAEEGVESPSITIWDCSGSGFTPIANIDALSTMDSLASFQLNSDLRKEIIAASTSNSDITVFRASTSGALLYPSSIRSPVPKSPKSVTSADLNGDGEGDIVLTSSPSVGYGALTIYYQSGDSVSNANDNQPLDGTSISLATVGNCDGGAEEVVTYDALSRSITFSREGAPAIRDMPGPENVTDMECHDLNGDGFEDLVMVSSYPRQVHIWFGNPNMLLLSYTPVKVDLDYSMALGLSLAIGDLDGDGDTDLAVGGAGGLDIFWNSGTGASFSQGQRSTLTLSGTSVASMAAIRVQGSSHNDTLTDLAIVNANSSRIEVYFQQTGATKFVTSDRLLLNKLPGISGLIAGDLNGDGREDLLTSTPQALRLYVQNGTYTKGFLDGQPIKDLPVPETVGSFAIGDLDDDGGPEVAFTTVNSTFEGHGFDGTAFTLLTRQTCGAAPSFLSLRDMDGDLKVDVVAVSALSRTISFYYQNNFAPTAYGQVEGTGHLEGVAVWFNANGSSDSFSDQDRLSYSWNFGDGHVASGVRVSNTFMNDGPYDVVLTVSDPLLAWDEFTIPVVIGDQGPVADFSFPSSPSPLEGVAVQFQDLSTSPADTITNWNWSFGDGQWSNLTGSGTAQHTYGWNGTFTVTLTVIDEDGSQNSTSRIITLQDSSPIADFSASSYSPFEGQEVIITDLSSFTADSIVDWYWDMGDGTWVNRTTGGTFAHTYLYNGTYQVSLVVRDSDGSEDAMTKTVTVRDSAPVAGFTTSVSSPFEGEEMAFNDTSSFPVNEIVSWFWDLGDGTTFSGQGPVVHTYADNGTFYVTLTVTDVDGNVNTSSMTMTVKDTSPVISSLFTVGGETTFEEWDEIAFKVHDVPQWDTIVRYQWDFGGTTFQVDEETDENSTSYRYASSGTYRVTVRVWDSDSFAESSIQITITDPAPIPDFTSATNTADRTVSFSAALTFDTENDYPNLMYRWNFGDTVQTEWNRSQLTNHTYAMDGVYSVRLEVRDDHNPAVIRTKNVTIDLLPPDISMGAPVLKAVVGEPTLIRVTVTDLVGIDHVFLEYTIDNVTRTIEMTSEGSGIYFAQIPAQNRTMDLTYRIVAEDTFGHSASTEQFTLTLEYEDPSLFIYTSLVLLTAFLVIIIYLFLSRPIVDEVFVMFHDGTLLAHQTRRLKPGMDDEILGGMLIALQNFVRDSFKDENSTVLRRMDFGERKLLVERKDDFYMAVVLSGKRAGNAAQRMLKVLDSIEEGYAPVLKEWDGDLEKVRGIRDETKPMFSRANPLDRLKRKEGEDDSV
jgi:PKD repeat protein